jgi:hypothetical protein
MKCTLLGKLLLNSIDTYLTSVQKIPSWLENDLGKIWDFELDESNFLQSVLEETPQEINRIFFQDNLENFVTAKTDFVVGYLISFIFHKFMLGSNMQGLDNSDEDLAKFLSSLIAHTPRLKELIELVSNEKDKGN